MFVSQREVTRDDSSIGVKNPFLDNFPDPLSKLNPKENSDSVNSFPMAYNAIEGKNILEVSSQTEKYVEAPSTPGRPIFNFSIGSHSRKNFPSKWDDAEKWLPKQPHKGEVFAEKSRVVADEKVSKVVSSFRGGLEMDRHSSGSMDVLLKDKFTNEVFMKEGFVFANAVENSKKNEFPEVVHEVKHKDVGTEMTPIGSSKTSRCHTPFNTSSPARHNTPANRSGPLALTNVNSTNTIDIKQLQVCHLAKLQLGSEFDSVETNWSSREEEEEDVSKSLRHFEINNELRKSVSESRACVWEEDEKNKCCIRYQMEEAKIQAWLNLQNAKAEAQSRKLEVKIQKMRSNLEEKLMKKMEIVHRKAEDLRSVAQLQHSQQIQEVTQQAHKMMITNKLNSNVISQRSCGCFPCNNHRY